MRDRILARIAESGPLSFDEYMAMCLYDPDGGFFSAGRIRPGVSGDFVTSPEVSPWFGRLVGRWIGATSESQPTHLVEIGAGSGSLLRPLLDETTGDFASVTVVEVSASARDELRANLPGVAVVESVDDLPDGDAIVLMNEVLDNVPARLVDRTTDGWHEVVVDAVDGGLVLANLPADAALSVWCDHHLGDVPVGARLAAQVAAAGLLSQMLERSGRTRVCVIDYAADTATLATRPPTGVVRTFRSHHEALDPLAEPGATDVTVELNSDLVERVAETHQATISTESQAEFLVRWGAGDVMDELTARSFEAARRGDVMEQLRFKSDATGVRALLDPSGLGGFSVFLMESGT